MVTISKNSYLTFKPARGSLSQGVLNRPESEVTGRVGMKEIPLGHGETLALFLTRGGVWMPRLAMAREVSVFRRVNEGSRRSARDGVQGGVGYWCRGARRPPPAHCVVLVLFILVCLSPSLFFFFFSFVLSHLVCGRTSRTERASAAVIQCLRFPALAKSTHFILCKKSIVCLYGLHKQL